MRVHVVGFALVTAVCLGVACSFPDVTFEPGTDGGTDGTLSDGQGTEGSAGDGGDAGGEAGYLCDSGFPPGTTEKVCGATCISKLDPSHGCGQANCVSCPGPRNGIATCAPDGGCGVHCDPPFLDCDQDPTNGCESNPTSGDPQHCGSCANACGDAQVCNLGDGGCGATCTSGTVCGRSCANLTIDPNNCGDCGVTCEAGANASPACNGAKCGYKCSGTYADCDDAGKSCEVDLQGNDQNCGSCGHACFKGTNVLSTCAGGSCSYGCVSGTADCNGDIADGGECECQLSPTQICRANKCVTCKLKNAGCTSSDQCCSGSCLTLGQLTCITACVCT